MVGINSLRVSEPVSVSVLSQQEDREHLDELLKIVKEQGIKVTVKNEAGEPQELTLTQIEEAFKRFVPEVAVIQNGFYHRQLIIGKQNAIDILNGLAAKPIQDRIITMETLAVALTASRLDDDITLVFRDTMLHQDAERQKKRDDLKALTAELKIYSVIQSEINKKLAGKGGANGTVELNISELNLLQHDLYGYDTPEKFKESAEFLLLNKLTKSSEALQALKNSIAYWEEETKKADALVRENVAWTMHNYYVQKWNHARDIWLGLKSQLDKFEDVSFFSIKDFLQAGQKESGQMHGLNDVYRYTKDNNDLRDFASMVNDRVRPINDKVSETTTLLNDISTRYNSAVEALSRFIQKYDGILREILKSI